MANSVSPGVSELRQWFALEFKAFSRFLPRGWRGRVGKATSTWDARTKGQPRNRPAPKPPALEELKWFIETCAPEPTDPSAKAYRRAAEHVVQSRELFERLMEHADEDAELTIQVAALVRRFGSGRDVLELEADTLALESETDHGVAMPQRLPRSCVLLKGRSTCFDQMLALLAQASLQQSPATIYINCRSLDDPMLLGQDMNDDVGVELRHALRRALDRGWTLRHLVRGHGHPGSSSQLVLNLLMYLHSGGNYEPVDVSSHAEDEEALSGTVLVEGIGVFRFISNDAGFYIPWGARFHDTATGIGVKGEAGPVILDEARSLTVSHGRPLIKVHQQRDLEGEVRSDGDHSIPPPTAFGAAFDEELTSLETGRRLRRVFIKPTPVVTTMPEKVTRRQFRAWRRLWPEAEYVEMLGRLESQRLARRSALTASDSAYRDIGTKEGFVRYLSGDEASDTVALSPLYSGQLLDPQDRVEHLLAIADLVEDGSSGYELALPDTDQAVSFAIGSTYWETILPPDEDAAGEFDAAVLFLSFDRHGRPLTATVRDSELAQTFGRVFDFIWLSLPEDAKDPSQVAAWLRSQASMTRP